MKQHDVFFKRSLILFSIISIIITIVDALLIIFHPLFLQKLLVLNGFFLIFAAFLALSRYGSTTLSDSQPNYNTSQWLLRIVAIEVVSVIIFINILQTSHFYLNEAVFSTGIALPTAQHITQLLIQWGLFPWATVAILACGLGYIHFRHNHPATISNITPTQKKVYYDTFLKRINNGLTSAITSLVIIVSISLGLLAIGKLLLQWLQIHDLSQMRFASVFFLLVVGGLSATKVLPSLIHKIMSRINNDAMVTLLFSFAALVVFVACYVFSTNILALILKFIPLPDFSNLSLHRHLVMYWPLLCWAWWVCMTPLISSAIARISQGRSLRSVIIATLALPAIVALLFNQGWIPAIAVQIGHALFNSTLFALVGPAIILVILAKKRGAELSVFGLMPKSDHSANTQTLRPTQFLKSALPVIVTMMAIFMFRNLYGIQFISLLGSIPAIVLFAYNSLCLYRRLLVRK